MLKGVFFDLYDTLIVTEENTASSWLAEFYSCLKNCGLPLSFSVFAPLCEGFFSRTEPPRLDDGLTVYERRIKTFCFDLNLHIDSKHLRMVADRTVAAATRRCKIDPHCNAVLDTLGKKYVLALISNYDHPPCLRQTLQELDLAKYFSAVVISGEVGVKKPDSGIFLMALQNTGLLPREVVYVGDSVVNDVLGAASVGITPVLIQRSPVLKDDFQWDEKHRPVKLPAQTRIIRQLTELFDFLQ
jgi:HAD superfamily hydrolase (TIGR01509 family)